MSRPPVEFVLLTDAVRRPRPWGPFRGLENLWDSVHWRLHATWGSVEYRPPGRPDAATRGLVLVLGVPDRPRFTARARAAVRSGVRVIALGGGLAGNLRLAGALTYQTGRPVMAGMALGAASLLDSSLVLLKWRGVDAHRARVGVLGSSRDGGSVEAIIRYLADRVGRIGVQGLDSRSMMPLAARIVATTGAALEVYRSVKTCLSSVDLAVLARPAVLAGPAGTGSPPRVLPDAGSSRSGPLVVADVRTYLGHSSEISEAGGCRVHQAVLRLTGPLAERTRPRAASGRHGPIGIRNGPPPWAPGPGHGPLYLTASYFAGGSGWSGVVEPGLPRGLVSAPLAEGVVATVTGRSLRFRMPHPRRQPSAELMTSLRLGAAELGLYPAGVGFLDTEEGRQYNLFDLFSQLTPAPWHGRES